MPPLIFTIGNGRSRFFSPDFTMGMDFREIEGVLLLFLTFTHYFLLLAIHLVCVHIMCVCV